MQGEITTDEHGNQTLGLPSADSISPLDQLKSDPAFVERYLAGDKAAAAQMLSAMQPALQPVQTQEATPALQPVEVLDATTTPAMFNDEPYSLNFGELARGMSVEDMQQTNHDAVRYLHEYNLEPQQLQTLFDRISVNSRTPIEDADAARDTALGELQRQWGADYESNLDAVYNALQADPELDELLYATGSWADPVILQSILEHSRG